MLVCTLPSPACMCSATNTRLRSTSRWIAVAAREHRREGEAGEDLLQRRLAARSSTTRGASGPAARRSVVVERGRARSCQRARVGRDQLRAPRRRLRGRAMRPALGPRLARRRRHACASSRRRAKNAVERVAAARACCAIEYSMLMRSIAVGVVAEALERDDDVLVDLERVGVLGDRRGARAVEPELLARLGRHGDEALAAARVGDAHDLRGGLARRRPRRRRRCRRAAPSSAAPWRLALVA